MFKVKIYIQSDLRGFRRQNGWFGAVIEYKKKTGEIETREVFGEHEATSNQMTLIALVESLKILNKPCEITVHTESDYINNMITQGRPKQWELNNWLTAKNEPVANKDEWQQLLAQLDKHQVTFLHSHENEYKEWLLSEIKTRKEGKEKWVQQRLSQ